jgi:hypothetical protein
MPIIQKRVAIFMRFQYFIVANVRVYDPLRLPGSRQACLPCLPPGRPSWAVRWQAGCQCAKLSSYTKVTKGVNARKPLPAMAYTRC